jgi:hypothetical protein
VRGWQKRRDKIREEKIGQTKKRVLLVEGSDDVDVYGILLNRRFGAAWERSWVLADTGKKEFVLDILAVERSWLGLVDRDEWSQKLITQKRAELPNLLVLPRFCLESYLVDPDELWAAFPPNQQAKIAAGLAGLRDELLVDKDKWLRHGVLWSVINPLWSELRDIGFKESLLDFDTAQDNNKIRTTLGKWHNHLDPQRIFSDFQNLLTDVMQKSGAEQLRLWVHGKEFYRSHVHQVLNRHLGQANVEDRMRDLFKTLQPNDLEPVWREMRLVQ